MSGEHHKRVASSSQFNQFNNFVGAIAKFNKNTTTLDEPLRQKEQNITALNAMSKLDQNTINFEELTDHWSSGDNVYGSGCQLSNTSPLQIFELAFSDKPIAKQFLDELIKNKQSSTSPDTTYTSSSWKDKSSLSSSNEHDIIKQRKLCIEAIESGFFSRKVITSNINQTAFFTPTKGTYVYFRCSIHPFMVCCC